MGLTEIAYTNFEMYHLKILQLIWDNVLKYIGDLNSDSVTLLSKF